MIRNLKTLGLALVAVFAMSAVAASGAMAITPEFETTGTVLDGTQTEVAVLSVAGGRTVTCETATLVANIAGTVQSVIATPTYAKCHSVLAGVKVPATVITNGCTYTINLTSTLEADKYKADAAVNCAAGKDIEVQVFKEGATEHTVANQLCAYTIKGEVGPPAVNQNLETIEITNNTAVTPKDVEAKLNLTNIAYTRTNGTIPNCGAASGTATLVGKGTVQATTGAGVKVDLTIIETA